MGKKLMENYVLKSTCHNLGSDCCGPHGQKFVIYFLKAHSQQQQVSMLCAGRSPVSWLCFAGAGVVWLARACVPTKQSDLG